MSKPDYLLPFKIEKNDDIKVIAAKNLINSMFLWKETVTDDEGVIYVFEQQAGHISRALAELRINNKVTYEESKGIVEQLSKKRMGLVV